MVVRRFKANSVAYGFCIVERAFIIRNWWLWYSYSIHNCDGYVQQGIHTVWYYPPRLGLLNAALSLDVYGSPVYFERPKLRKAKSSNLSSTALPLLGMPNKGNAVDEFFLGYWRS